MTTLLHALSLHKASQEALEQSFRALVYELFCLEVSQASPEALLPLQESYAEFDFSGCFICFATTSSQMLESSSLGHSSLAFSLICSKPSAQLSKSLYTKATQAINRAIPSYNIIFFLNPQEDLLTISFATRREHKRAADQDVLEKIIIIKDISLKHPSKGHLRNLATIAKATKHKSSTPIDQLYQESIKSLSIESLNQEFYKEVVGIFISLIDSIQLPLEVDCHADFQSARNDRNAIDCHEVVPTSRNDKKKADSSSDNTKREFSLRLLSRLLFCKFLEKKGVIGAEIFSPAFSQTCQSYYHEVLEPLFFSTLNTPKDARDYALLDSHIATLLDAIPYLNGGLFAPQASDFYNPIKPTAYHNTLKVPNEPLRELFALLERYHFSIDESTPDSQEVGLNPELLGMVFESLLSELFTDNKKDSTASLRKSTGSYYTPREIDV